MTRRSDLYSKGMTMNDKRTYPYKAWVLTPSFKPKEVELVQPYRAFGGQDYGDLTETGKMYGTAEMFESKRAAVLEGWRRHDEQAAKLDKMRITLEKRRQALRNATAQVGAST